MPEIITTLGLLKSGSDVIKEALHMAREAKNTDLAEKLLDVYQNMLEVVETNAQLREEIALLKKQKDITDKLTFDYRTGAYFLNDEGKRQGPFCGTCWDIDRKLVRMVDGGDSGPFCDWCCNRRPKK